MEGIVFLSKYPFFVGNVRLCGRDELSPRSGKYLAEERQEPFVIPAERDNLRQGEAEGTLSLFL